MTYNELNDLIFYSTLRASKMSNDSLFKGLSSFLYQYLDDFKMVLEELEYIKSVVRYDNKSKDNQLRQED